MIKCKRRLVHLDRNKRSMATNKRSRPFRYTYRCSATCRSGLCLLCSHFHAACKSSRNLQSMAPHDETESLLQHPSQQTSPPPPPSPSPSPSYYLCPFSSFIRSIQLRSRFTMVERYYASNTNAQVYIPIFGANYVKPFSCCHTLQIV